MLEGVKLKVAGSFVTGEAYDVESLKELMGTKEITLICDEGKRQMDVLGEGRARVRWGKPR